MTLRVSQKDGVSALSPTYTEPTEPTGLTVLAVTVSTAMLRCNPSQPTDSTYVAKYRWYVDGSAVKDTTTNEALLVGLDDGTTYTVAVSAISSREVESEQSNGILVTTVAIPDAPVIAPTDPSNLEEYASPADYIAFSWDASQSLDELPLLGYRIYRDGSYAGQTDKLYWLDEGVSPDTSYTYQVEAYTAGEVSNRVSITIRTDALVSNQFAFLPIVVPTGYRAGQTVPLWQVQTVNGQGTVTITQTGTMYPGATILSNGTVPAVTTASTDYGTYTFTVRAEDSTGQVITQSVTVTLGYAVLQASLASIPPSGVSGSAYSLQSIGYITISGGDGTYNLTKTAGNYPGGLSLGQVGGDDAVWDISGTISGGSGQTYPITLYATSGDGQSYILSFSISVQAVTTTNLELALDATPNFTVNSSYSTKNLTVTGATGTITVTRSGTVPAGMTASTSQSGSSPFAMFGGTPTEGYSTAYTGTITATDSSTPPKSKTIPYAFAGNAAVPGVTITIPSLGTATVGTPYSKTITISGGVGPFYGNAVGLPPPGVLLSPDIDVAATSWDFTGTPSQSGAGNTYSGNFAVYDAGTGITVSKPWTIPVDPLSTAWIAPSQTNPLPTVGLTGGTSETKTYNTSSYISAGDATDLVVGIESTGAYPLPAGVSLQMNGTGIGGQFQIVNSGILNPSIAISGIQYRLTLTYTDPTSGVSDAEADWIARSTGAGVYRVTDFREYADTAALLAASQTGYNQNSTASNNGTNFRVDLDTTDGITGGKCLKITTYDTATAQGGGFGLTYRSDGAAINGFYFQFAIKLNEAAAYWEPVGTNSNGTADTKKVMQLESYGTGQVSLLAGTHGFPSLMVNGSEGVYRVISTGTGYGGDQFRQCAINNGLTVTSGSPESFAQNYGLSKKLTTDVSGRYLPGTMVNQQGYQVPEPNALIGGSVPYAIDGWTVIEIYVYNDLTNNANDRFKMWAAPYGQAPKLIVDNRPSGSPTINGQTLGVPGSDYYKRWEALNYPTRRIAEPGRPVQVQKYDQMIPSANWIPFPGHLTGTEP